VLFILLALAHQGKAQGQEDTYAKANPKLGQLVKVILKLDTEVKFREIAFGPPEIKDLKGAYAAEFAKADKTWRLLRFATDYGDYLLLEEDKDGAFKKAAPLMKCRKTGITNDDVRKLLTNVK
jgi:hypothetical protein